MLTSLIYGKEVAIKVKTIVCLWHTVAGTKRVRMVVTRDPSGRISDRAYFTTDADRDEDVIIVQFARRWEIEVAFRNTKQALGLEDPQNGWWHRPKGSRRPNKRPGPNPQGRAGENAINHTLASAFVAYALTIVWYMTHGQADHDVARVRAEAPWYRHKTSPSFNDMLAAARRELWVPDFLSTRVPAWVARKPMRSCPTGISLHENPETPAQGPRKNKLTELAPGFASDSSSTIERIPKARSHGYVEGFAIEEGAKMA